MLNVLNNLLDTITSLVQFVINSITSLINLLIKIPTYTTFLINSINVLPSIFIPFAIACISIYVVLFVINR